MSCGNSNCDCGSSCGCGSGCNCKYPNLGYLEKATDTATIITGVAQIKTYTEGSVMSFGAENEGCGCGNGCQCDPCTCK